MFVDGEWNGSEQEYFVIAAKKMRLSQFEEERLIKPAITLAKNNGIRVEGPFPADTLFSKVDQYDAIVAMYHDQGLIPVKLLSFGSSVNWTVGTPIIRTSPDHGTAFDIAHSNQATENSILQAIELAYSLSTRTPLIKSIP